MKKLLSLVMVLVLSLALAACSDATTGNPDSAGNTDTSTAGSSDTSSDSGSQADEQTPETITIKSLNASQKEADQNQQAAVRILLRPECNIYG